MGIRDENPFRGVELPALIPDESWFGTLEESGGVPTQVSRDMVFEVLKNERRRSVLDLLERNGGRATLSELSERIAARENGIDRGEITSDQRKRVYVGLYQRHLPKMDELGAVDFEQRSGDVILTDIGEQLCTYPSWGETGSGAWTRLSLAVGLAGLGVMVAGWAGLLPARWSLAVVAAVFGVLGIVRASEGMEADVRPSVSQTLNTLADKLG